MDAIRGQSRALDLLQAALRSDRLHHAFIFHGPAGVGKFTAALAFAKVILCHERLRDLSGRVTACDSCPSCRLLKSGAAGGHPDLHVITKELARFSDDAETRKRKLLSIPIEIIRDNLIGPAFRSAALRHGKVFIIDEAELLGWGNDAAQNAMLKVLEEPPAGTVIILVTAHEDRLLATIRSRCQRVAFVPLADAEVERWAAEHAREWSAAHRRWLAEFAAGSLGRAALAVSNNLSAWADVVLPALDGMAQGRFPAELGGFIAQAVEAFAKRWVDEHENASKEAANKLAASLMWALMSRHARKRIAELAAGKPAGDPGLAALGPWLGVIDALAQVEMEISANVNPGLAMDHLVSRLHRALSGVTVEF